MKIAEHIDGIGSIRRSAGLRKGALLLCAFAALIPQPVRAETFQAGQFEAVLQEDNALLPGSIRWAPRDIELLRPETGLSAGFTSLEFRNKIYHEENRAIWAGREEPRMFTDAKALGRALRTDADYTGIEVELESSYARYRRSLLFHRSEPRFRIEYAFEFTRDVVLHETEFLGISLQAHTNFSRITVWDARGEPDKFLSGSDPRKPPFQLNMLGPGPRLLTDPVRKASLLLVGAHAGAGLDQPPARLVFLPRGQRLTFSIHGMLGPQDDPLLLREMSDAVARLPADRRPSALVEAARLLAQQGRVGEAETALLDAAKAKPDYATPWSALARLREEHKLPGATDAWIEAGYRMPYNYGYMLSGMGWADQKGVSEEQRRLHQFNLLMTVENTVFYPDYYLWAARGFQKMNMIAQACAMYRQALWAADYMPRSEAVRQKLKEDCRKQIAEFEAIMRSQSCTNLPPLIPLRNLDAGSTDKAGEKR